MYLRNRIGTNNSPNFLASRASYALIQLKFCKPGKEEIIQQCHNEDHRKIGNAPNVSRPKLQNPVNSKTFLRYPDSTKKSQPIGVKSGSHVTPKFFIELLTYLESQEHNWSNKCPPNFLASRASYTSDLEFRVYGTHSKISENAVLNRYINRWLK